MGTTKGVVEAVTEGVISKLENTQVSDFPLIKMDTNPTTLSKDDLAIFAVPVYAGRVPEIAVDQIRKFKGDGTRAIIVVVYGNRDYDDALLELQNIVTENGFLPVAAGAFIAQHSIFSTVATNRPDADDLSTAREFGAKASQITKLSETLKVPGNHPYKKPGAIPFAPRTCKGKCIKAVKKNIDICGVCAAKCPVGAIGSPKPKTDKNKCIKCGYCISVCPYDAREWGGILHKLVSKIFTKQNLAPKKSELFYLEN